MARTAFTRARRVANGAPDLLSITSLRGTPRRGGRRLLAPKGRLYLRPRRPPSRPRREFQDRFRRSEARGRRGGWPKREGARMWLVRWSLVLGLAALALACGSSGPEALGPTQPEPLPATSAAPTARYRVTFDATWSVQSHPREFPPNAHFSPLVGGTHSTRASLWATGGIASDGIEAMAERGNPALLADEVRAAVGRGNAEFVLRGDGLPVSPGSVALEFQIGDRFPLVTLVTMVAPSPDWFAG